jgi:hypothetical protein
MDAIVLRLDLAQHRLHLLQYFTGLFRVKRVHDFADCLHLRVARIDPGCDQPSMQVLEHFISFEHRDLQAMLYTLATGPAPRRLSDFARLGNSQQMIEQAAAFITSRSSDLASDTVHS